jgi:hypothetical protein
MRRDIEHLNALAICHFIYAGLELLAVAAGVLYLVLGIVVLNAPPPSGPPGAPPPPVAFIGWLFIGLGSFIALLSLAGAIATLIAGLDLRKHRRWTFSFVMAFVNAVVGFPIGTVLGVFTILVLLRPSVKDLYSGERYVVEREDDYVRYRRVEDRDEPPPYRSEARPDDDRFRER